MSERLMYTFVGLCLGAVVMLVIVANLSKDLLLGTSIGMVLGIILTMFYEHSKRHQPSNQGDSRAECTCVESRQICCVKHDPKLLMTLSCNIPDVQLMTRLGIKLGLNPNAIKSCWEDNRGSIEQAVFEMMYHKWYKMEDGLGLRSEGLKVLEQALKDVGCGIYINTIVQRHFHVT